MTLTKHLTFVAAGVLASLALGAPAVGDEKPAEVRIGYLNLVNAQLVTKHLGLQEKELGVPVKWLKFGSGGDVNKAIAAEQLDFGGLGNPPSAIGITRGLPYQGILALNILGDVEALSVRTSKNINSVADLAGKTVAAPFGSTTHYLLLTTLKQHGLKPGDVKLLDLNPADAAAAWLRGDIDAAWIWEPNLDKTVKNGGKILIGSGTLAKNGYPTWDISVVVDSFAKKHPDLVAKFVKAECAGIDYWLKNPEDTARIVAEELTLPIEDAKRMIAGTAVVPCSEQITAEYLGTSAAKGKFVDTLVSTARFLVEEKRLPEEKPREAFEAFVNPSYLEAALASR